MFQFRVVEIRTGSRYAGIQMFAFWKWVDGEVI